MNYSNLIARLSSRKFLLAVLGVIVAFGVPLTTEQLAAITVLITAFIAAEGGADIVTRAKELE